MKDFYVSNSNVIIVDDEINTLRSMELILNYSGINNVQCFDDSNTAKEFLKTSDIDCAVLDIMMPNTSGKELLSLLKNKDPDVPVIMATGLRDLDTAIECMKMGANDYILKPVEEQKFIACIKNALKIRSLQKENSGLCEGLLSKNLKNPAAFSAFGPAGCMMANIFKYIEAIASTAHPVLITGETGVGKELVARSIHDVSGVKGEFVAVNVAGLDDTVFSDSLFGHVKGAFTGADNFRKGMVETAADGTLFLDEIGDLSLVSQVKLLRLLQELEYRPVGSDTTKRCDARIITATCKPLEYLAHSELFRKDLYFRLSTHHIAVPPLRERKEDLPQLVRSFFTKECANQGKKIPAIPKELFTLLNAYHFPGNIRELQSMVFNAVSVMQGGKLSLYAFKNKIGISNKDGDGAAQKADMKNQDDLLIFPNELPNLKHMEEMLIAEAMSRTQGNQTIAANLLGITRQALGYRLKHSAN